MAKSKSKGTTQSTSADELKLYTQFFGGIVRDDKSTQPGVMSNVEELDILENANFVRPTLIFSNETLPANTEFYAYCVDDSDTAYYYGKNTSTGKAVVYTRTSASSNTPGSLTLLVTSAANANILSPIEYHKVTESSVTNKYVYYVAGTNTVYRYGPLGGSPTEASVGSLSQIGGTGFYDRITFRRFYGTLYITNGIYISQVDDNAVFTEKKFTLPFDVYAVDIAPASDVAVILCRYSDRNINKAIGYWWDLASPTTFDDHFDIPMGGPQWIYNYKQTMVWFCAANGIAKMFQLSSPNPGAVVIPFPNIQLNNVATEGDTQPISPTKSTFTKDDQFYFGVYKTDKTGLYAIGKLDYKYPIAIWLAKRFNTTDYSKHAPIGASAFGQNFYCAYADNGTNSNASCLAASANRSSNAVIESTWQDNDKPMNYKDLEKGYVITYPIASGCSVTLSVASDYSSSYTALTTAGGVVHNIVSAVRAIFRVLGFHNKFVFKWKVSFTSSGTSSVKLAAVALRLITKVID